MELTMPVEQVKAGLTTLEAQPRLIRQGLMRWIGEARLAGQRQVCRNDRTTKG